MRAAARGALAYAATLVRITKRRARGMRHASSNATIFSALRTTPTRRDADDRLSIAQLVGRGAVVHVTVAERLPEVLSWLT